MHVKIARNERGLTLLELLVFLGIAALITAFAIWYFSGKSGSPTVPGGDLFKSNIENAESLINSIGSTSPTSAQCDALRTDIGNAQKGIGEMSASGAVNSGALRTAEQRLSK